MAEKPSAQSVPAPVSAIDADGSRRGFLKRAALLGSAALAPAARVAHGAALDAVAPAADTGANLPPNVPQWNRTLGAPILSSPYGVPSTYEANIVRRESPGLTRTPYSSVAFTPLQNLFGVITPSGLHFERHHAGIPDVHPGEHRLMI